MGELVSKTVSNARGHARACKPKAPLTAWKAQPVQRPLNPMVASGLGDKREVCGTRGFKKRRAKGFEIVWGCLSNI